MDKEMRIALGTALDERLQREGKKMACPMCGHTHVAFADGAHLYLLQQDIDSVQISGKNIPSVAIVCTNCGFLSQHAIGALMPLDRYREMAKAAADRKQVGQKEGAGTPNESGRAQEEERHG